MTTWLTRIVIASPPPPRAHADLADAIRMHKRVMSLVPGFGPGSSSPEARKDARVLYRVEGRPPGDTAILIQSATELDPGHLPRGYGTVRTGSLDGLLERLSDGMTVQYRLAANTVRVRERRRNPVRGDAARQWWTDRAARCGLELITLQDSAPGDAVGIPRSPSGEPDFKRAIRHAVTQFDGYARVSDAGALTTAIRDGVGRARSYGCGLLSIIPAE